MFPQHSLIILDLMICKQGGCVRIGCLIGRVNIQICGKSDQSEFHMWHEVHSVDLGILTETYSPCSALYLFQCPLRKLQPLRSLAHLYLLQVRSRCCSESHQGFMLRLRSKLPTQMATTAIGCITFRMKWYVVKFHH